MLFTESLQQNLKSLTIVGLLTTTLACTSFGTRAESFQKTLIKDELYFGLSKPGGQTVSEVEWQQFLNCVITPRFKEGLTVMDANGQYLSNSGKLTKEKSKLIILVYEANSTKNKMVQETISTYKKTFQQESVLRVTSNVHVSF
ncbi:MAG: DUF3574 domain-containing protein [Calothrix sp. C42_A2020_038]|nr:DUF3574 domain-containing protein [Calothrix sp. C42_A2020_038]